MSAPKPPDPVKTAEAQAGLNKETAITQALLGMTNQITPFGSLTYTPIGTWSDYKPGGSTQVQTADLWGGKPQQTQPRSGTFQAGGQAYDAYDADGNDIYTSSPPAGMVTSGTGNTGRTGSSSLFGSKGGSPWGGEDLWDMPRFQVEQTLTPDLQATIDNYLGAAKNLSGQVNSTLSKPIDLSGLPDRVNSVGKTSQGVQYNFGGNNPIQMSMGPQDWSEDRQRVEDALMSRLNPQLDRDRARTEADLRARGMAPGSGAAYSSAMDELNRQSTDARMAAILAGGQEQSRLAGLDLMQGQFANAAQQQAFDQAAQRAGFANAAQMQEFQQMLSRASFQNSSRQAGIEELFALRNAPINEINALLQGTQLAGPKFTNTPQPGVNGVDYTGLVNQQYQAQMQSHQGMLGGIAGIGSSLLGLFSDRRLKEDIKPIGKLDNGLTVYSYRMKGDTRTQIGLMADEVAEMHPGAIIRHPSGFAMVNYAEATR